jgi:hypothetical protein
LTFTSWPLIVACTFDGTGTGFLPMRDMSLSRSVFVFPQDGRPRPLRHPAVDTRPVRDGVD